MLERPLLSMISVFPCGVLLLLPCLHSATTPYAVDTAQHGSNSRPTVYSYDTAGNRLKTDDAQSIVYGLLSKPIEIRNQGSQPNIFKYGFGAQRYLRIKPNGDKIFYLGAGAMEYSLPNSGTPTSRFYLKQNHTPIAHVDVAASQATPQYAYYLRDHLGSAQSIIDEEGVPLQRFRHDPWGKPVAANGVLEPLQENYRSFTGHEYIAAANMLHMNGRVYDFELGQFLGPDRYIQAPIRFPSLNRYCYIQQSPLQGIDPTGWVINRPIINFGMDPKAVQLISHYHTALTQLLDERSNRVLKERFRHAYQQIDAIDEKDLDITVRYFSRKNKIGLTVVHRYQTLPLSDSNRLKGRRVVAKLLDLNIQDMRTSLQMIEGAFIEIHGYVAEALAVQAAREVESATSLWRHDEAGALMRHREARRLLFKPGDKVVNKQHMPNPNDRLNFHHRPATSFRNKRLPKIPE